MGYADQLREPLIVLVCGSMARGYLEAAAGVSPCTRTVCARHRWVWPVLPRGRGYVYMDDWDAHL